MFWFEADKKKEKKKRQIGNLDVGILAWGLIWVIIYLC